MTEIEFNDLERKLKQATHDPKISYSEYNELSNEFKKAVKSFSFFKKHVGNKKFIVTSLPINSFYHSDDGDEFDEKHEKYINAAYELGYKLISVVRSKSCFLFYFERIIN